MTFGLGYTLRGFFGTDVDTSYEYKLVRKKRRHRRLLPATPSTPPLTRSCAAVRPGWPAKGSWSPGATSKRKSAPATNSRAKLTLTYPYSSAAIWRSAVPTSARLATRTSMDEIKDDYTVYQLKAGLEFGF